jgi:Tol biopolymer transport system component
VLLLHPAHRLSQRVDDQSSLGRAEVRSDVGDIAFVRWFLDEDWRSSVMIRDLTTGEERALTEFQGALEHPEWSPDGRSIIAHGQDDSPIAGTVFRFDVDQAGI